LDQSKIMYAALDAYASVAIHDRIASSFHPHASIPTSSIECGDDVLLFLKTGVDCVARGTVCPSNEQTWGRHQMETKSAGKRVVILVTKVFAPGALTLYPGVGSKTRHPLSTCQDGVTKVLWDMQQTRLATPDALDWLKDRETSARVGETLPTADQTSFSTPSDADRFFDGIPTSKEVSVEDSRNDNPDDFQLLYFDGVQWLDALDQEPQNGVECSSNDGKILISLNGTALKLYIFPNLDHLSQGSVFMCGWTLSARLTLACQAPGS
jgi:hypothetical protein